MPFGTAKCPHCGYRPIWFLGIRCYNCGRYTIGAANLWFGFLVFVFGMLALFLNGLIRTLFSP